MRTPDKKKGLADEANPLEITWRPQPDLNRCCRRERPVSLARLDDGDDMDVKNTIFPEKSMIIKPRNNPKVNRQ